MTVASQCSTATTVFSLVAEPALKLAPVSLENGRWTIGRATGNRIIVSADGIADRHCLLLVAGERLMLKSWSNATRVNGEPTAEAVLSAGDVITLGTSDFQVRRQADFEETPIDDAKHSISGRVDSLAGLVEQLDRELSNRQNHCDRLDGTIERIQATLDESSTPQSTVGQLREQIVGLQADTQSVGAECTTEPADPRIQTAQHHLDRIMDGFEENHVDATLDPQFGLRIEKQLRRLESLTERLEQRATVIERQAQMIQRTQEATSSIPANVSTVSAPQAEERRDLADPAPSEETVSTGNDSITDSGMHEHVNDEREKLRVLMQEFETVSTEPVTLRDEQVLEGGEENAELREVVTAAVVDGEFAVGDVVAGKRSRDEAIRQLDELIRSTDESLCEMPMPVARPDIDNDSIAGRDTVKQDDSTWNGARIGSMDVNFDEGSHAGETTENLEACSATDTVEATLDFATDQIDALSEELDPSLDLSMTDESGDSEAGVLVEEELNVEDIVDESVSEFGQMPDWSREDFSETVGEEAMDFGDQSLESLEQDARTQLEAFMREPAETTEEVHSDEATNAVTSIEDLWRKDSSTEGATEETLSFADDFSLADPASEPQKAEFVSEEACVDELANEETEERVDELRAQLAQMFDMPADSSADTSSRNVEQENLPSDFAPSGVMPADDAALPETSPQDEVADLEPSTPEATTDVSAEGTSTDDSNELDATNPDSINAYMEALLARNRRHSANDSSEPEEQPSKSQAEDTSGLLSERFLKQSQSNEESTASPEEPADHSWMTEEPKHKQDRDAIRASMATLRQVANESARSAVARATRTQMRKEILTLTGASLICLIFAVAAAVLKINPILPLCAVGLSLFFAVKLGLSMRKSWAVMRQVKQELKEAEKAASA